MNGTNGRRLMLKTETLRNLQDSELMGVAGGAGGGARRRHTRCERERTERTGTGADANPRTCTHLPDVIIVCADMNPWTLGC